MKRLALTMVALLFACGETPTEPLTPDLGLPEPSFDATVFTESIRGSEDDLYFVSCANGGTGEYVQLAGTVHILLHLTTDDRGGRHVAVQVQWQGVTGTGVTTGDVYRSAGGTSETRHTYVDGSPFIDTSITKLRLIGPGRDNNLLIDWWTHVTVNGNGDMTADVDLGGVDCI